MLVSSTVVPCRSGARLGGGAMAPWGRGRRLRTAVSDRPMARSCLAWQDASHTMEVVSRSGDPQTRRRRSRRSTRERRGHATEPIHDSRVKLCTVCGVVTSRPSSRCTDHAAVQPQSAQRTVRRGTGEHGRRHTDGTREPVLALTVSARAKTWARSRHRVAVRVRLGHRGGDRSERMAEPVVGCR
jgi:hypothetical protein